ncbi:Protein of unknown function [Bacillus cereus]|nr:Protein of unknown function [Bacillus cereus]
MEEDNATNIRKNRQTSLLQTATAKNDTRRIMSGHLFCLILK